MSKKVSFVQQVLINVTKNKKKKQRACLDITLNYTIYSASYGTYPFKNQQHSGKKPSYLSLRKQHWGLSQMKAKVKNQL